MSRTILFAGHNASLFFHMSHFVLFAGHNIALFFHMSHFILWTGHNTSLFFYMSHSQKSQMLKTRNFILQFYALSI